MELNHKIFTFFFFGLNYKMKQHYVCWFPVQRTWCTPSQNRIQNNVIKWFETCSVVSDKMYTEISWGTVRVSTHPYIMNWMLINTRNFGNCFSFMYGRKGALVTAIVYYVKLCEPRVYIFHGSNNCNVKTLSSLCFCFFFFFTTIAKSKIMQYI